VSRASLSRNGPRSGLSRDGSSLLGFGESGGGFLVDRTGEGLDRDGVVNDGEGGRLLGVDGCCGGAAATEEEDDAAGAGLGTEIRSGGASTGVLTETRPGILCVLN
jgi:hypothetical protein